MIPSFLDMIFNSLVVFSLIIFFLAAYDKIVRSVVISYSSLFNLKGAKFIEKNINNLWERIESLIFLISLLAFIVTNIIYNKINYDDFDEWGRFISFFAIVSGVILYYFIKILFVKIISWVNNNNELVYVNNMFFIYAVLFIIPVFIFFIVTVLFPQISLEIVLYPTLSVILLIYMIYIIRGYQMIIANGFSHFFYILYLCTVELLPLIFFVHFIFN